MDFRKFPGGILKDTTLFLPIPIKNGDTGNFSEGFTRQINSFKIEKSIVSKVFIIPIDLDNVNPDFMIDDDSKSKINKAFYSWGLDFGANIEFKTLNNCLNIEGSVLS